MPRIVADHQKWRACVQPAKFCTDDWIKQLSSHFPGFKLQSVIDPSQFPDANVFALGLNDRAGTRDIPFKVPNCLPVWTSQSLIVVSTLPDANILPSGLKDTDNTSLA